jgi:CRP/FNR family cyclic AMP-dependent transcriptional regulator
MPLDRAAGVTRADQLAETCQSRQERSVAVVRMTDGEARDLLGRIGWLSRTPPGFRSAVLAITNIRRFPADTSFIVAGDALGGCWAVANGQVDLVSGRSAPDAPPSHIAHPGSWWGAAPLFGRPRFAGMTARTDVTLGQVPLPAMRALLEDHPGWWRHIGELVLEQAELASGAAADLLIRDSQRLAVAVMLRLSDCRHADPQRSAPWGFRISQEHLAEMCNLSRQSLGLLLRDLERRGLVHLGYREVILRDTGALRAIVDG